MKVAFRDTNSFVNSPPAHIAAILVYGPDYGLMKERAEKLGETVVSDLNDPFNVSVLSEVEISEDGAKLSDEANAVSMMGGKRLVRITDGSDKIEASLRAYLKSPNPETLIIVEARELSPRSKLRSLCEKEKNAASLACYVEDERDLGRLISDTIREAGHPNAERDAIAWLGESLKGDRRRVLNEISKLLLYKGQDKSPITLTEAMKACGNSGARSLEELSYACSGNNGERSLKVLEALKNDGVEFMTILRTLQNHYKKLYFVKQLMGEGLPFSEAKRKLAPPLFFKVEKDFERHVYHHSDAYLSNMLSKLIEIESYSKKTGYDPFILIGQFVAGTGLRKSA